MAPPLILPAWVEGVEATLGALTVINQGTISGSGSGVFLTGGGSVSNATSAARITGGKFGVFFSGTTAGTVANKGTISGAFAAVQFSNKANNNLFREFPGAVTSGLVSGGSGSGNTLELGSAATTGTITGIGGPFVGFQVFDVDTGAKWVMTGANALGSVATIGLAGTGSLGVTGTLTAPANLTITGIGTLAASGGGRIEVGTAGTAVANQIVVDAAHTLTTSGVLSAATLAVASGGLLIGAGTLMGTMANAGTVEATGGTLDLTGSVDPASTGLFTINTASLLEIAADTGAGNTMSFIGSSGELAIDAVAQFGTHVGQASYTGPLIENFGTGEFDRPEEHGVRRRDNRQLCPWHRFIADEERTDPGDTRVPEREPGSGKLPHRRRRQRPRAGYASCLGGAALAAVVQSALL